MLLLVFLELTEGVKCNQDTFLTGSSQHALMAKSRKTSKIVYLLERTYTEEEDLR